MRAPDLFFVRAAAIPATCIPEAFWQQAPDLVVEVVSPSETAGDVLAKVRDYLNAGTRLVWVCYPRSREVLAHRAAGTIHAYNREAWLEATDLLPGFRCRVAEILP